MPTTKSVSRSLMNQHMRSILIDIPIPRWSKWLYTKWKIEKWFEAEVFTFLRKQDYLCYHVPDLWLWYRYVDGIIDCPDGTSFRIEFKKTDGYTFNMSQFEESQIKLLEWFHLHGNEAYIMVYSQKTKTYWVWTYFYLKTLANSVWGIRLFDKT